MMLSSKRSYRESYLLWEFGCDSVALRAIKSGCGLDGPVWTVPELCWCLSVLVRFLGLVGASRVDVGVTTRSVPVYRESLTWVLSAGGAVLVEFSPPGLCEGRGLRRSIERCFRPVEVVHVVFYLRVGAAVKMRWLIVIEFCVVPGPGGGAGGCLYRVQYFIVVDMWVGLEYRRGVVEGCDSAWEFCEEVFGFKGVLVVRYDVACVQKGKFDGAACLWGGEATVPRSGELWIGWQECEGVSGSLGSQELGVSCEECWYRVGIWCRFVSMLLDGCARGLWVVSLGSYVGEKLWRVWRFAYCGELDDRTIPFAISRPKVVPEFWCFAEELRGVEFVQAQYDFFCKGVYIIMSTSHDDICCSGSGTRGGDHIESYQAGMVESHEENAESHPHNEELRNKAYNAFDPIVFVDGNTFD
ncbi:hypothetical protein Tco_0548119 [Tanacetum coccineum]